MFREAHRKRRGRLLWAFLSEQGLDDDAALRRELLEACRKDLEDQGLQPDDFLDPAKRPAAKAARGPRAAAAGGAGRAGGAEGAEEDGEAAGEWEGHRGGPRGGARGGAFVRAVRRRRRSRTPPTYFRQRPR